MLAERSRQIVALEGELVAHFDRHPDVRILRSEPGLGAVLAARVLAEFGDDPTRFTDAEARRNYAGTIPITRASGIRRAVLARVACNKRLRDALCLQAFTSLTKSPNARAYYYDARRARGATHHQALHALANRLVGILHGCLRHHRPYAETIAWSSTGQPETAAAWRVTGVGCLLGHIGRPAHARSRSRPGTSRTCRPPAARPAAARAAFATLRPGSIPPGAAPGNASTQLRDVPEAEHEVFGGHLAGDIAGETGGFECLVGLDSSEGSGRQVHDQSGGEPIQADARFCGEGMARGDNDDEPVACELTGVNALRAHGHRQPPEANLDKALVDLLRGPP